MAGVMMMNESEPAYIDVEALKQLTELKNKLKQEEHKSNLQESEIQLLKVEVLSSAREKEAMLKTHEKACELLKQELEEKTKIIERVYKEHDHLKRDNVANENELKAVNQEIKRLSAEIQTLETRKKGNFENIRDLNATISTLKNQMATLNQDNIKVEVLTKEKADIANTLSQINERSKAYIIEINALKAKSVKLQEENNRMQEQLNKTKIKNKDKVPLKNDKKILVHQSVN